MDKQEEEVIILIVCSTFIILLLVLLLVNLLLTSRNRKLKHLAEMNLIESNYKEAIAGIRTEVVESTLAEISGDLHDEVGQLLTFSILQLNNLRNAGVEKQKEMLEEVRKSLKETLDAVRSISRGLHPGYIQEAGIVEALEQLIYRAEKRTGLNTNIESTPDFRLLKKEHNLILFRIVQECLTNTLRHAGATVFKVSLREEINRLIVEVSDDGKGLPASQPPLVSVGLQAMKARALLMKSEMSFISHPEKGTSFILVIPK